MDVPSGGIVRGEDGVARCWGWSETDLLNRRYHDEEWGRPVSDDLRLFEKLCLEGFMSGLSWLTILRKRENFRKAFRGFDPVKVSRFDPKAVGRLMNDAGIVRNRAKIEATINNARGYAPLAEEFGSLAAYVWGYEPPASTRPRKLDWATLAQTTFSPEAKAMSRDLKKRGWAFVGPTTVYSMMQACGL
ncbi:MAG: DNA-3-methyladenine glycosylase I, partial [Actinomycetota bacterium]